METDEALIRKEDLNNWETQNVKNEKLKSENIKKETEVVPDYKEIGQDAIIRILKYNLENY